MDIIRKFVKVCFSLCTLQGLGSHEHPNSFYWRKNIYELLGSNDQERGKFFSSYPSGQIKGFLTSVTLSNALPVIAYRIRS